MKRVLAVLSVVLSSVCARAQAEGRSLTLGECLEMASSGNVTVRNAHLDYLSAKMQKNEALAYYFPTVNFNAIGFAALNPLVRVGVNDILGSSDLANNLKYYIETVSGLTGLKTTYEALGNAYGMAFTFTQPLYAGGRIVNGNRLASLGVEAAVLSESRTRRDVATEVERKYWLVVSLEEKMRVLEDGISLAESLYKDVSWALSAGLVTSGELEEVGIGRQDLKAKQVKLKGGIMLARLDLCNAVGLDCREALSMSLRDRLGESLPPEKYYMDPAAVAVSVEESQLLDLSVRQKQLEKKIAMGDALPQVGVGATYSYGRLIGSPQNNGAVFATVKVPITDWAKTGSRMKNIDYQIQKASGQRDHLRSMLELQLRQMWVEVESAWEELQLKEEKAAHARTLMDRALADVRAGIATESSLMERQVALSNAGCELVDARIAYRNAVADFRSRCRGGQTSE